MKTAVVLFNLGGPDSLSAVKPFLFNLFSDRAIINLPNPFRYLLAKFISSRRAPTTALMYKKIGNKSPLLDFTRDQATALQAALGADFKVFICMRYFHPDAARTVAEVRAWGAERVLLLPLYPQYSSTTTASSYAAWQDEARKQHLQVPTRLVCCYPAQEKFIAAHVALMRPVYEQAKHQGNPLVIFSAHGLPKTVIARGDPYQWHIEQTAAAITGALPGMDSVVAYQSRVSSMMWTTPYTDEVIKEAARAGRPVVVVPIAFVSEHSETLVELDMDYRELAEAEGCPGYFRVPALGTHPDFIAALAEAARLGFTKPVCSVVEKRLCPPEMKLCPCPL